MVRPAIAFLALTLGLSGCTAPWALQVAAPRPPEVPAVVGGNLTLTMLDVGQGQAILLTFPSGATMLYDGGPTTQGDEVLAWLQGHGVQRIDWMVVSHAHEDHLGGFLDVLRAMPVLHILDPGVGATTATYDRFRQAAHAEGAELLSPRAGALVPVDPQAQVRVLNPPEALRGGGDPASVDENSYALVVSFGSFDALLTGDLPWRIEAQLAPQLGRDLEVLQVAHHGSSDATSREMLDAGRPEVGLISVGQGNPYGHPHPEALAKLQDAGVQVWRTDQQGAIQVTSNGVGMRIQSDRSP